MTGEALTEAKDRMDRSCEALRRDLAGIRAGRASPALLEKIMVEYYGTPTPLQQVANISAPEARLLVIQPWDRSVIPAVEKAILKSDLGLSPSNDGQLLRLVIPQLTEERRKELVRQVKKRGEEEKVVLRNIRREIIDQVKKRVKDGEIPEDEGHREQDEIQKITDAHVAYVDELTADKEREVLEV